MNNEKLKTLSQPFPSQDIEWRVAQCGWKGERPWAKVLAYVTNRAIQQRLDDVFGVMGWRNEFKEWHGNSQLCGISVYDDEKKEWITKWDGADSTDIESTKGGLSDSMKRAGVQWGIGRYLYNLEEAFAVCGKDRAPGAHYAKPKTGDAFYWQEPSLPAWALPGGAGRPEGDILTGLERMK